MNLHMQEFKERRDAPSPLASAEKYTVLAIDDDIAIIGALKRAFRKDFNILTAYSVNEALSVLTADDSIDLIITDYHMPEIKGTEGVDLIRQIKGYSQTPIIMVTGENSHDSQTEAFETGIIDFVSKPILFPALAQKIKNTCNEIQVKRQLEDLAFKDPLTNLYNRRSMQTYFDRELNRCKRLGHECSVVVLDIDHFKSINDNYGHDIGDQALKLISNLLLRYFQRTIDYVARLGGEEFVLILSQTESSNAQTQLQEFRNSVKNIRLVSDGKELNRVISISAGGVTLSPNSNIRDPESLLKAADKLLYEAKKTRDTQVWDFFKGN